MGLRNGNGEVLIITMYWCVYNINRWNMYKNDATKGGERKQVHNSFISLELSQNKRDIDSDHLKCIW